MDQELKQRLIGVIVITALAAIFIPMLFDNPVDEGGQIVNELTIPEPPVQIFEETAQQLPATDPIVEQKFDEGIVAQEGEDQYLPLNEEYVEDAGEYTADFRQNYSEVGDIETTPQVQTQVDSKTTQALESASQPFAPLESRVAAPQAAGMDVPGWYIQLGSFSKQENASTLYNKLKSDGLPVIQDEIITPAGKAYRLRVGPESDKKRAETIQSKLDKLHKLKSILTSVGKPAATETEKSIAQTDKSSVPAKSHNSSPQANAEKSVVGNSAELTRWFVQLGSFSKQNNAIALRDKLRSQGFAVNIDEITTAKGKSYRLRAGPELNKKKAEEMKLKLDKITKTSTILKSE